MRRPSEIVSETDEKSPSAGGNDVGNKTIYYESYGCASNRSDIEIMLAILNRAGYREVDDPSQSSAVIVNTCAVKKTTEDRMLERLERLGNLGRPIIVTGCLPRIDLYSIRKVLPDYAVLLDPASVCRIAEAVDRSACGDRCEIRFSNQPQDKSLLPRKRLNRFIEIVPISEGCSGACTYCCTRFARGRLFSFSPQGIIEHARRAISEGAVEIQTTGQDTASYSSDGLNLGNLLQEMIKIEEEFRVRVGMMNPDKASRILNDLVDAYESPKIYKFLHIPVQSGSDRILELMNRRYRAEDFVSIIKAFRSRFPTISVATDVIVGFPSEDEEDFEATQDLIQKTKPDVVNISKYAPRPKTPASKMKQLDSKIVTERSRRLARVASRIVLEQNMRMVGSREEIYPIEKSKHGSVVGRTHNYKKTLTGQREVASKMLKVKITGAHLKYLICEVLDSSG